MNQSIDIMKGINPYLNFMGNSEEAMKFYKSVLGGKFTSYQRYADIPGGEKMPPQQQEKFVHIALEIENGISIMATDVMEPKLIEGNNFHICLQVESENEAEKLFEGLSKGGKIEMPLNKTFWGSYFGMCTDKFGIQWMLNYTYNQ
ncbi:MAG: VOC family protein [Bacteroidota bacterium]